MSNRELHHDHVGGFALAPPLPATGLNSIERYDPHLRKVLAFYDSFANDISRAPSFHLGYEAATRWLHRIARTAAGTPLRRILDLCCGQAGSARLVSRLHDARTFGLDINLLQLMMARERRETSEARIALCCANAETLPVREGVFDLIISEDALAHSEARGVIFREARRVLRMGGCLVVTDVIRRDGLPRPEWDRMLEAWALAELEDLQSYAAHADAAGLQLLRCEYVGQKLLRAQLRWDKRHEGGSYEEHLQLLNARAGELVEAWGDERYRARLARLQTFAHLKSGAIDYALIVARRSS